MKRSGLLAVAVLLLIPSGAQARQLGRHEAVAAVRKDEHNEVRDDYIDRYRIKNCVRRGPRRIDCWVHEDLAYENGVAWTADGWSIVRSQHGRVVCCRYR